MYVCLHVYLCMSIGMDTNVDVIPEDLSPIILDRSNGPTGKAIDPFSPSMLEKQLATLDCGVDDADGIADVEGADPLKDIWNPLLIISPSELAPFNSEIGTHDSKTRTSFKKY